MLLTKHTKENAEIVRLIKKHDLSTFFIQETHLKYKKKYRLTVNDKKEIPHSK